MFSKSSQWYDLLYQFKDYQKEADKIFALLRKIHPEAKSVLNVACGTAEHDRYLSKHYKVDGIDLNEDFIAIAKEKNPTGHYFYTDMIDFNLFSKYDCILCLFSSIGYVKTIENVAKTLSSFKKHLNPNGFVLIEPWFGFDGWKPGTVHMLTAESKEGKICRMNVGQQEGSLSVLNFHYLIATSEGVQHHTERHELGLFSIEEMLEAFKKSGLKVKFDENGIAGRGMYIAKVET
jgi:SAM-dependent methyltransferase